MGQGWILQHGEGTELVMIELNQYRTRQSDIVRALSNDMYPVIFPSHLELVPQLNETYELELAFYESRILSDEEIVRNGAYFVRVGGTLTRHFLICEGEPVRLPQHSSSRLRSFFQKNQFRTGYGTHGLFPYRGKFHPQMIKGLINVMGLKSGETVVDPMMGSGTVLIEAALMGINSVGIDVSPFCCFMTKTKLDGLTVPLVPIRAALANSTSTFEYFSSVAGQPRQGSRIGRPGKSEDLFSIVQDNVRLESSRTNHLKLPDGCEMQQVYNFLLLAYLDSAGYAERSNRKSPFEQFEAILQRYLFVVEKIQRVLSGVESDLAPARVIEGDARRMPLEDSSVDGIIFSPPYSFAIDYLENDSFHLTFLGVDHDTLREKMIGLRGITLNQKFDTYKADMELVLSECARVLRPGRLCTIVVGTNNNQLSKILNVAPEDVEGIDEILCDLGSLHGLRLIRKMSRQISGMANTMRTEYILMLERN
jgi:ubiquinone/menaquinone biosynthesis C-methylase UbiE